MRITIDTREDSYEDALGVLRRAYGRHRLARTTEEPPAVPEAVFLKHAASALPAKPAHITATATAAAQVILIICKLPDIAQYR